MALHVFSNGFSLVVSVLFCTVYVLDIDLLISQ